MKHFVEGLRAYARFSGRSTRTQFWSFLLVSIVLCVLVALVDRYFQLYTLGYLCALFLFLPTLAICVRRLRDSGRSGWWVLILIIPMLGVIVVALLCLAPGKAESPASP